MKNNVFSCLGAGSVPPEQRRVMVNTENRTHTNSPPNTLPQIPQFGSHNSNNSSKKHNKKLLHKSQQPIPRSTVLNKSMSQPSSPNPMHNNAINVNISHPYVFRSRPIASFKYEPFKILLLIASAEGYHHNDFIDIDPRLSDQGIKQCKIVSSALRAAKQSKPDIMYCSTTHRALNTMQLVCNDWYDDGINMISTDLLRPKYGKYLSNKRGNINKLKLEFKKVRFHDEYINDDDKLWKMQNASNKLETDNSLINRINIFLNKYLITEKDLLSTNYGTKPSVSKLNNLGFSNSPSVSITSDFYDNYKFAKRIVVVSHREIYSYLIGNVIKDVSPSLCKEWKHCDLRKVFVYTKQQLGIIDIPRPQTIIRTSSHKRHLFIKKKLNLKKTRSRTPTNQKSKSKHKKTSSMGALSHYSKPGTRSSNINASNRIQSTQHGSIIMTSSDLLFKHHSFTLTSCSQVITQQRNDKVINNIKVNTDKLLQFQPEPVPVSQQQPSMVASRSAPSYNNNDNDNDADIKFNNDDDSSSEEIIDAMDLNMNNVKSMNNVPSVQHTPMNKSKSARLSSSDTVKIIVTPPINSTRSIAKKNNTNLTTFNKLFKLDQMPNP